MVYGIVKQSVGFIFVSSTPGVGTQFELWFPYCAEAAVPLGAATLRKRSALRKGGVVLLVEDEAPVRTFAARALRHRGYTVLEAPSGEEALALLADRAVQVALPVEGALLGVHDVVGRRDDVGGAAGRGPQGRKRTNEGQGGSGGRRSEP